MSSSPTFADPPPTPLLEYFAADPVHTGRGTAHLNALTDSIIPLLAQHPLIAPLVEAGEITYFAGARMGVRGIDLELGPPAPSTSVFDSVVGMLAGRPSERRVIAKYTSIMTEHAKAQRNRANDFNLFAMKCGMTDSKVIRVGVCPVNAANEYNSHTGTGINKHGNGAAKAARAIDIIRSQVPIRTQPAETGLDAMWTPVVATNNAPDQASRDVAWLRQYPQPADGEPLSLAWFVDRIAQSYVSRYGV